MDSASEPLPILNSSPPLVDVTLTDGGKRTRQYKALTSPITIGHSCDCTILLMPRHDSNFGHLLMKHIDAFHARIEVHRASPPRNPAPKIKVFNTAVKRLDPGLLTCGPKPVEAGGRPVVLSLPTNDLVLCGIQLSICESTGPAEPHRYFANITSTSLHQSVGNHQPPPLARTASLYLPPPSTSMPALVPPRARPLPRAPPPPDAFVKITLRHRSRSHVVTVKPPFVIGRYVAHCSLVQGLLRWFAHDTDFTCAAPRV